MPKCQLCPGKYKCIQPDGPLSASVYCLGEAPGSQEERKGQVFIGKTGEEVNKHYLPLAGLTRHVGARQVLIGNVIACLPDRSEHKLDPKREADIELLNCCFEANMGPLIARHKPKVVVAMGSFACRAIDPEINLEFQHGIPLNVKGQIVVPFYHPSLALYEPKKMLMIRTDWIRLGEYLKGKLVVPVDEYADNLDYEECENEDDVHNYLFGHYKKDLANDTENRRDGSAFCYTFSHTPGTGRLIRAERADLLEVTQEHLDMWRGKFLWHNWPHDWKITDQMNLRFNRRQIVDTMNSVFNLGNLPQGLKALCYRELGMNMSDFEDIVKPHSTLKVLEYLRQAQFIDWPKPEEHLEKQKDGHWKIKKPHGFAQKVKTFFTVYAKDPESKDVFAAWDKNWEAEHDMIEDVLGPYPGMCISHAPFETVKKYAIQDADGLGRLWPTIKHMAKNVRKTEQHKWRE